MNSAQIRRPQVFIEEHGFEAGVPQLSAQQRDAAARAKVVRGPLMTQQMEPHTGSTDLRANEL